VLVPHHPDEKKLSGSTALVTGAGGFIGSHLVERLVSLGCKVKAFLRYTSRQQPGLLSMLTPDQLQSVEFIYGDLLNETLLANAAQNCDYIFHLGALIGIPYSYVAPRSYVDVNITGSLNVLLAAQAAGVKRVIQTSTSEVYGTAQ